MGELAGRDDDITGAGQQRNWMGEEFRDHPCYGLLGDDPRRTASAAAGREATERLIDFLARWLDEGD
jgi:hypothetical protein